jgi:hypothetical protein
LTAVWLSALLLIVAFDSIQPPAFPLEPLADAVGVALLPCITHPVTVMR